MSKIRRQDMHSEGPGQAAEEVRAPARKWQSIALGWDNRLMGHTTHLHPCKGATGGTKSRLADRRFCLLVPHQYPLQRRSLLCPVSRHLQLPEISPCQHWVLAAASIVCSCSCCKLPSLAAACAASCSAAVVLPAAARAAALRAGSPHPAGCHFAANGRLHIRHEPAGCVRVRIIRSGAAG
jgi:hypothetical protein